MFAVELFNIEHDLSAGARLRSTLRLYSHRTAAFHDERFEPMWRIEPWEREYFAVRSRVLIAIVSFSLQSDAGWEEYYDYIFPDDEANMPNFKLLQMARNWKKQKAQE